METAPPIVLPPTEKDNWGRHCNRTEGPSIGDWSSERKLRMQSAGNEALPVRQPVSIMLPGSFPQRGYFREPLAGRRFLCYNLGSQ